MSAAEKSVKSIPPQQATQDPLTELYSRAHVMKLLPSLLANPVKQETRALIHVRPDRFGEIDERLGPTASDALLKLVADRLKKHMVTKCLLSRFAGASFLALVTRPEIEDIRTLAETVHEAISAELFEVGELSTTMTASIGVLILPAIPQCPERAISMVQGATRLARENGGDRIHFEEPGDEANRQDAETARWGRRAADALKKNNFRLLYQPIANLDGTNSISFDVLLRMLDDDGNEVPPGDFMPGAEQAGLMPDIDRWVIKHALAVAARRHSQGKKTRIFVRLSEATLRDNRFFGWLGLETLKHRLDRDSVVLQLTERIAERCLPMVRELSGICRDMHLKIALASTGEEASYVPMVENLDLDFVVLDGSAVRELESQQLKQLINIARQRDTQVIASRVESAAELSRLYMLGVDYVAGFHVHKPEVGIADDMQLAGVPK